MTPPVLPDALLIPEHSLAALVLAVEVLCVLHLALLEPAALVLLEPEEVLLPHVVRQALRDRHEGAELPLRLVARAWRQRLGQGHMRLVPHLTIGLADGQQRGRGGARGQGPAGGWGPLHRVAVVRAAWRAGEAGK